MKILFTGRLVYNPNAYSSNTLHRLFAETTLELPYVPLSGSVNYLTHIVYFIHWLIHEKHQIHF